MRSNYPLPHTHTHKTGIQSSGIVKDEQSWAPLKVFRTEFNQQLTMAIGHCPVGTEFNISSYRGDRTFQKENEKKGREVGRGSVESVK